MPDTTGKDWGSAVGTVLGTVVSLYAPEAAPLASELVKLGAMAGQEVQGIVDPDSRDHESPAPAARKRARGWAKLSDARIQVTDSGIVPGSGRTIAVRLDGRTVYFDERD